MADIYKAVRGTLIRSTAASTPSIARLTGFPANALVMITGCAINRSQVVQYIKTLDDSIFGYAWGEGVGKIMVSGLIFFGNCSQTTGEGVGLINSYYEQNNVYKKSQKIIFSLGSTAFSGYLEQMDISAEQNEFNYAQFSFNFSIVKGNG